MINLLIGFILGIAVSLLITVVWVIKEYDKAEKTILKQYDDFFKD